MYRRQPNWVLGFHGTDVETVKKVLCNPKEHLTASENDYDWLGSGIYFWENDPERALQFAKERMKWKKIRKKAAVIGAVIDLGLCLNLFDQSALSELKAAYDDFEFDMFLLDAPMPVNEGGKDRLFRRLDCAVIEHVHRLRKSSQSTPEYQTVRSGFHEGGEVYAGSGFQTKNHIQIAVRNRSCIKGYFLPRPHG
ncbi:hypothetical protein C8238_07220 [Paracidovorax avenae]|uniref:hypothetical protein n=1 Tax=Paracidovorax avenae TaxID=80867 RepID=UPI000D1545C3|nr:hypothetical protein [Paracidovorax avenae]AVS88059.1 hypothetical protein C8238_07220 [Paracidovorax avenae]